MGATVYDVAREAGVSMKTAARVLAGEKTLPKNAESVLKAARQLGYVRNLNAVKLAQRKHRSLGVVIPSLTNPFYAFFADTIFREAHARGFQVLLESSFGKPEEEERCLRSFLEYSVAGVILNLSEDSQVISLEDWMPLFQSRGVPLIVGGWPARKLGAWDIRISNAEGIKQLVHHLATKGHRRIAFLSSVVETVGHCERARGFTQSMKDHGLDSSLIRRGAFTAESGRELALDLLSSRSRPTALVAANDVMALGAYQAAYECGLKIPQDVAITGFDDVPLSRLIRPSLTTVRQPQEEIARDCVALIERCLESKTLPVPASLRYKAALVIRQST